MKLLKKSIIGIQNNSQINSLTLLFKTPVLYYSFNSLTLLIFAVQNPSALLFKRQ